MASFAARCCTGLCFILLAGAVAAQMPDPTVKYYPRKADVKYIKCDVCKHLARNSFDLARKLMDNKTPDSKVDEAALIDAMELVTTAWKEEGEWITRLWLSGKGGGRLTLREMGRLGECGEACKTIERAAQDVMGEHDTDVAEALFARKRTRKQFEKWMCDELVNACSKTPPALPKDHVTYSAFVPQSGQNMDRFMGEMNEKGLGGQMYRREDLLKKYEDEMEEMGMDPEAVKAAAAAQAQGGAEPAAAAPVDPELKEKVDAGTKEAKKLWEDFKANEGGAHEEL